MKPSDYGRADFEHSPLLVFYETTQACDLKCAHCRAEAQPNCHPEELSTTDALRLVDALTMFPRPPHVVLTGGDPIKRPDIFDLVIHGVRAGLRVSMTPSATPLLTRQAVRRLKEAGLHTLAVSLDGADAATHDGFRGVPGSYQRTLEVADWARGEQLPLQINTTISRHNLGQVDAIADRLTGLGIVLWSVFFLVPVGRAAAESRITPEDYEAVFHRLYAQSRRQPYAIKSTEAPHYRRFVAQQRVAARRSGIDPGLAPSLAAVGTNDGRGVMFVSHTGEIFPSGFLPIHCGRFPADSPVEVYQRSATFRALRQPDFFAGKCGQCEFRQLCGGSRSRAYALTGDALGSDPDCAHVPQGLPRPGCEPSDRPDAAVSVR